MAGYRHRITEEPKVFESDNLRFVCSGEYVAFGIDRTPVFETEGPLTNRHVVGANVGDNMTALDENEWSPFVRLLPTWVEFTVRGHTEPDLHCRIELRDNVPRVVQFGWSATDTQHEIRQKHLKAVSVDEIANMMYGLWVVELRGVSRTAVGEVVTGLDRDQARLVDGLLQDMRAGRRNVDAELLRQVADIYRANFGSAPVQAVARVFGVKPRMAHEYVKRARDRNFLPPTTQGKKKI